MNEPFVKWMSDDVIIGGVLLQTATVCNRRTDLVSLRFYYTQKFVDINILGVDHYFQLLGWDEKHLICML